MTSAWKDFYCWTDRRSFICKFYYAYPAHRWSNKQTAIRVRRSGRTWWSWKPLSPGSLLSWSGPPLAYGRFPSRPHRCTPGTSSCGQAARSTRTGSCHTKKAPCSFLPCIHQYGERKDFTSKAWKEERNWLYGRASFIWYYPSDAGKTYRRTILAIKWWASHTSPERCLFIDVSMRFWRMVSLWTNWILKRTKLLPFNNWANSVMFLLRESTSIWGEKIFPERLF
mgnify:CR=1 FL=1